MGRIGVLGGMGPLATQLFYGMIIELTDAARDQDHIDMIILNHASMPDRTEALLSGNSRALYTRLAEDCVFLEKSGVSHIAIPCNTSHFFLEKLRSEVGIPIINMIEEAVAAVKPGKAEGAKVGILATDGTVRLGLYQKALEKAGFSPVIPSGENQKRVMRLIYDGVKAGGDIDMNDFAEIEKELAESGCACAIMGCTELSCFMRRYEISKDFYTDAMEALAKRAITAAGGKLRKEGIFDGKLC